MKILFAGSSHPALAKSIAKKAGIHYGKISLGRFSDGEVDVQIQEDISNKDVFILQPTCTPVNDNLIELGLIADAARRMNTKTLTAIIPYFGYSRKDRISDRGEPISAKVAVDFLVGCGVNRIIVCDLHNSALMGFTTIPIFEVSALSLFAQKFSKVSSNLIVFSPDAGGVKRARTLARLMGVQVGFIEKSRSTNKRDSIEIMSINGEIKGKNVVIVDDLTSTGSTLIASANHLKKSGARSITACVTHALFKEEIAEKISCSALDKIIYTDTVSVGLTNPKFEQLSVSDIIVSLITQI